MFSKRAVILSAIDLPYLGLDLDDLDGAGELIA